MAHSTLGQPALQTAPARAKMSAWQTVVLNDAVNLTTYVSHVFQRHFGYSAEYADQLMWQVHDHGRAVVSTGLRERMEADVLALHAYGLRALLEPAQC